MTLAVAVLGASGAMGQRVLARIAQDPTLRLAATLVRPGSAVDAQRQGDGVSRAVGPGCVAGCDVVIDFSAPAALIDAAPHLTGVALVSGTTGLDERARAALADLGRTAPVLHAANFSVGVHLLLDLVARAAAAMPDADVEVVEIHHRRKRDAPSGTALALGAAAQRARSVLEPVHGRVGQVGARTAAEIGYHAVRGGDVVGDHTVWFLADGERVALQHQASSRDTFAAGAVRAARWIVGRPAGVYTMADVIGVGGP